MARPREEIEEDIHFVASKMNEIAARVDELYVDLREAEDEELRIGETYYDLLDELEECEGLEN